MASLNNWTRKFGHSNLQNLVSYLLTHNTATQSFTVDGNANDVETDNAGLVFINGTPYVTSADSAYDISGEAAYADWTVSTSYTTMGTASEVTVDGRHFACILAHTSSSVATASGDKPLYGVNWRTYWRELDFFAVQAVGDTLTNGEVAYYLACCLYDGTLRLFKAYQYGGVVNEANAAATVCIPAYDPTRYCPVGLLKITSGGGGYVCGTTSTAGISVFTDLIGPVLPDPLCLDKN